MSQALRRRRHSRQDLRLAAQITTDEALHEITVLNLSLGGAYVTLPIGWTPANHEPLNLAFHMKNNELIQVQAHVTRLAVGRMGLAFDPGQLLRVSHLLEVARLH